MRKSVMLLGAILLAWGVALPAGSTTVKLSSELLTLRQLPKGYVAASTETLVPGCNTSSLGAAPTSEAAAGFDFGALKGFPQINESLAAYKNVQAAFNALISALKGCAHVTGTKNGTPYTVTVTPMTFGSYGDQSAAYSMSVSVSGTSQSADLISVRKGSVLLQLAEVTSSATVSKSAFSSLTMTAVGNL